MWPNSGPRNVNGRPKFPGQRRLIPQPILFPPALAAPRKFPNGPLGGPQGFLNRPKASSAGPILQFQPARPSLFQRRVVNGFPLPTPTPAKGLRRPAPPQGPWPPILSPFPGPKAPFPKPGPPNFRAPLEREAGPGKFPGPGPTPGGKRPFPGQSQIPGQAPGQPQGRPRTPVKFPQANPWGPKKGPFPNRKAVGSQTVQ